MDLLAQGTATHGRRRALLDRHRTEVLARMEQVRADLEAIDAKIAGKQVVASAHDEAPSSAQVIDLMAALRASLGKQGATARQPVVVAPAAASAEAKERKGARRAPVPKAAPRAQQARPASARTGKRARQ